MSTAFPVSFKSFLALAFSLLFSVVNTFTNFGARGAGEVKAPADFMPAVRFIVCSDVHFDGADDTKAQERFADFIQSGYSYAQQSDAYNKLDAVCVCGDFTNSGKPEQYQAFMAVANANVREGTELITALGNHEFHDSKEDAYERYETYIGKDVDTAYEINGFHFVGVSYDEDAKFADSAKRQWLDAQLANAKADNPDYPVFVFQHPHPFATVYGSVNWGEASLGTIYSKYPQVINFSGHSHYPMNDPRSIWQGSYTALGCGTLKYFELENELFAGQFPAGNENAAQFYIVEADASGSVRILGYDLITHTFFENVDYYIETPAKKSSFQYTYSQRMKNSSAPVFAADASAQVTKNESGEYIVSFPAAADKNIVHDYKIKVTDSAGIVSYYSQSHLSDYYYQPAPTQYLINLGALDIPQGKGCKVTVTAANAFAQLSKSITGTFVA